MNKLKKLSGMKKILLAIFALFPVLAAFAQTDLTPPTKNFDPYWIVGVKYGFTQIHGDVSDKSFFGKLSKESKPSIGISLSKQITPFFSFNADFTQSNYYSRNRHIQWHDKVYFIDLSVTGKITMLGVSGTLNINKLINKESGNNWHAFVSGGVGFQSWNCTLQDEYNRAQYFLTTKRDTSIIVARVRNSKYNDYTFKDSTTIGLTSKLYSSLAFGVHFQLTDRIGVKVEHAIRYAASDLIDGFRDGNSDVITTTTLGVTIKLGNLLSHKDKTWSYPTSSSNIVIPKKRLKKGTPTTKPELQEYSGYNALLPPPLPKVDTTRRVKSGANNTGKNIWVAESDSGQLQITGNGKVTNDVYTNAEPQVSSDLKTGLVPTYRVQIQASKTYIQVESVIKKLDLKEKVSVELRSDGWYRYYIGQYALLSDARVKLAEMRAKGLKDAFVVSFKTNTRKVIK
jgi:hypothetical protein